MTLVLTIVSMERLDNGESARLRLDRHGALIGRSPHMDWSLPDPKSHISSSHCEIQYRDGGYVLIDKSTNGTYVNHSTTRLSGPHVIADGDVILIGHYEIVARLETGGQPSTPPGSPIDTGFNGGSQTGPEWGGWDSHVGPSPVGVDPAKWDRPPPQAAITGQGSASAHWAAPRVEAPPQPASAWDQPQPPAAQPSGWSSAPVAPAPPAAADIWGALAANNEVDWSRGFGGASPIASEPVQTFGHGQASFGGPAPGSGQPAGGFGQAPPAPVSANASWGPSAAAPAPPPPAPAPMAAPSGGGGDWQAFLTGAGLQASELKSSSGETLRMAGVLLRRLVGGMVVMMEARARAKAQLGAQNTSLEFDGNNPLKFARSADGALAQLLSPPERGFMAADRAIEDSFRDLQAHQLATLTAMQGALAETLERFSPSAIRERAEGRGLLAKIMPGARAAALWKAYEQEFEGVTQGSDEAFMDVFAREFREAYERVSAEMKSKRGF
jgi:type VI secretion system FHA domain protein